MRRFGLSLLGAAIIVGGLAVGDARADDSAFKLLGSAPTGGATVQATPVRWGWGGYGYRSYRPYYGRYSYRPYYGGYRPYGGYYRPYYGGYYGGYGYRPGFGVGFGFY